MKAVVRGTVVAAALVLALTGCEEDGSPAAKSVAPPVPGESEQVPVPSQTVWLDPTGLMNALPVESNVGDAFVGDDAEMVQGADAVQHCAKESGAACAGLAAAGLKEMEARGSADETRVEFTLYSFETAAQAGTVMKGLADTERKASAEYGDPAKPVTVSSGADETDAFQDGDAAKAVMRIGTVVAYVYTTETEPADLEHVTKLQVDRVKTVAAGKNPGY
ncbi:hypothetical protein ACIOHE_25890 [Streptomyces sp. NPDC087851]|uniref:hypothetical protein n=1 Tax=Streptomyces sp. NPDC087851 TaxID=3365810 RepID=UPI0037FD2ED3